MIFAAILMTAPVPRAEEFFPTRPGTRWVYKGDGTAEVVTSAERDGGYTVLRIGRERDGKVTPYRQLSVSAGGLFAGVGGRKETLEQLLRLPARAGDTWSGTDRLDGRLTRRYTVAGEEDVTVPAGKYRAVRVDVEAVRGGGVMSRSSSWYAPGVGLVRVVSKNVAAVAPREVERVLETFTPGRKGEADGPPCGAGAARPAARDGN